MTLHLQVDAVISSLKTAEEKLKDTPKQLLHSDVNDYNVIVGEDDELGIIDFNDMTFSYRVFDLGHFLGYMIAAQHCNLSVSWSKIFDSPFVHFNGLPTVHNISNIDTCISNVTFEHGFVRVIN